MNHKPQNIEYCLFYDFPDVLTVRQMQAALQIGRTVAYRLLKVGEIQSFRIGNSIRIPKKSLILYVQRHENLLKYSEEGTIQQNDHQSLKGE